MVTKKRILGSVLLLSGTAIGAGMLALPLSTAHNGFYPSAMAFLICWFFMTLAALILLEVNLSFPGECDLISMVNGTFGARGKYIATAAYLLLLYSLIGAYLKASTAWFSVVFDWMGLPVSFIGILFGLILVLSFFLYRGISLIDKINGYLMIGLVAAYGILIASALPQIDATQLKLHASFEGLSHSFPLMITSFGFSAVLPSLTAYLHRDAKALTQAILLGSLIPLAVYLLWEGACFGIIPLKGANSFEALAQSSDESIGVASALAAITGSAWVTQSSQWFSVFAILTSMLGVSLALFHFLKDSVRLDLTRRRNHFFLIGLVYFFPAILVLFYPASFGRILSFAGMFVSILLGILPASMAWHRRYSKKVPLPFKVWGGKALLLWVMAFFVYVTYWEAQSCGLMPWS